MQNNENDHRSKIGALKINDLILLQAPEKTTASNNIYGSCAR